VEAARVEVHLAHVDGGRTLDPLFERGRREEDLFDGQGEGVLAARALLVRAIVKRVRFRRDRLRIEGGDGPSRQDLPGGDGGARNQGQELRDLLAGQAALDPLQEGGQLAHAREALRQRSAQAVEHGARREGVGEGEHLEPVEGAGRALGLGIERAQALDGVPEELDAHRRLAIRREDIEDPSAPRDLAGRGDRILAAIPPLVERFEEDFGREVFTAFDRDDARLEQPRREDRPQEAGRRGDESAQPPPHGRVHGGRPPQRAPPDGAASRETCRARSGEREDRARRARLLGQCPQVFRRALDQALRADHDQQRGAGDEQRDEETRGPGEPMDGDGPSVASIRALPRSGAARRPYRPGRGQPPAGSAGRLGALTCGDAGHHRRRGAPRQQLDAHDPPSARFHFLASDDRVQRPVRALDQDIGREGRDHCPGACPRRRPPRGPRLEGRNRLRALALGHEGRP
jgi:hypothetical protein